MVIARLDGRLLFKEDKEVCTIASDGKVGVGRFCRLSAA